MTSSNSSKVASDHLKRDAYLYVRQSTMRQVIENGESTRRQYALQQRAAALGWAQDQIVVIDTDLGQSGASAVDREGFQKLVSEVGLGRVGIVLGLEVSRLARNNADWHRLLEICALSGTLILDEDGLYDPRQFNDRLLLGLKGTMSEAELHVLRARLHGGVMNKAQRGELQMQLPIGLVYDPDGRVVLDPDQQIRETIRTMLRLYRETGTARQAVRAFRAQGLKFPTRSRRKGSIVWGELTYGQFMMVLKNPRYAGVFYYGQRRSRRNADGRYRTVRLPMADWHVLIPEAHEGYLSWPEFQENQRRLSANTILKGGKGPAREGNALLQGLVLCGRCGGRMYVSYRAPGNQCSVDQYVKTAGAHTLIPYYICGGDTAIQLCQNVHGVNVDGAVAETLRELVTPLALEASLKVQADLNSRIEAADRLRHQQVERARYQADLAQRRFMQVDPDNRLVADTLEADWNARLAEVRAARDEYERHREQDRLAVSKEERESILALATDFPRLWQNPLLPMRERKRIIRLLIEDVTLTKGAEITVAIRFKGGASSSLTVPLALSGGEMRRTDPMVIKAIDALLDDKTYSQIATELNARGYKSGMNLPFNSELVKGLRALYDLKPRLDRLRERGLLTIEEVAGILGVCEATVRRWRLQGKLRATALNDHGEYLFEAPSQA
jgi:DNA invertase Pin-like site-specific DNA recombinase